MPSSPEPGPLEVADEPETSDRAGTPENLSGQILKATSIIGGSSVLTVLFSIIQAKVAALVLGPGGVGIIGLFKSATSIASTLMGMGLNTSAVREIADASATGDRALIARTIITFRRVALLFGLLGAVLFFLLRKQISVLTFGNEKYAFAVGCLALVPFLVTVSNAQSALVRGMRRIGDLARVSILGSLFSTIVGLPVLVIWKELGIAPFLVLVAAVTLLFSWWYSRKISIDLVPVGIKAMFHQAADMVSLGALFMSAGLASLAAVYLVKVFITKQLDLGSAGLFEASSTLANVYVGFVLGAMAADFFPHLSSVAHDNEKTSRLINAQVEIGLLVAAPGVLGVIALGPYVIKLLYSSQFAGAYDILRWQALGTFLRVVSWPIGFLLLARKARVLFFLSEVGMNISYVLLTLGGLRFGGLAGVGPSYFITYLIYTILMTIVAAKVIGFRWSRENVRIACWTFPALSTSLVCSYLLSTVPSLVMGLALTVVVGLACARRLLAVAGNERIDRVRQKILEAARFWKT